MEGINKTIKKLLINERFKKFYEKYKEMIKNGKYIETENFGAVKKEDYDKYEFLRKDNGVPHYEVDKDGARIETGTGNMPEHQRRFFVSSDYLDWKEKAELRSYVEKKNEEDIDRISNDPPFV